MENQIYLGKVFYDRKEKMFTLFLPDGRTEEWSPWHGTESWDEMVDEVRETQEQSNRER